MNLELQEKLARVARQIRSLRLWSSLAICWLVWATVGAAAYSAAQKSGGPLAIGWIDLCALALITAVFCAIVAFRSARDKRAIARRIESRHPELATMLLAAVEQSHTPRSDLGYLQKSLLAEAVAHGRLHNWPTSVVNWRLRAAKLLQCVALGLLIAICVGLANHAGANSRLASALFGHSLRSHTEYDVTVDPGNCDIERGSPLLVVAEFTRTVPPDARLILSGSADASQSLPMVRSLDDPKFVARVPAVNESVAYQLEFAGQKSDKFRVKVFDYPALVHADARLEFPRYTSMDAKVINDVRHTTAVEGTQLTLECHLNKSVASAELVSVDGERIQLEPDANDKKLYRATWKLATSRRLKLQLVDSEARANKLPEDIIVTVLPNQPSKVALERPARDVDASPLEELQLKWKASDDFGVVRSGVTFALGGKEPRDVEVAPQLPLAPEEGRGEGASEKPQKELNLAHLIALESLEAKSDDLLSYFVWAEDIGPDGQPRRVQSDMYFAEVRPFEQIFRQGEQPSAGEQQQQQNAGGQQAEELAELQKQIMSATWKLFRRESATKPTTDFASDSKLVKESQQSAIDRAEAVAEQIKDAQSRTYMKSAQSNMKQALKELATANQKPDVTALSPALSAEQAAYQDLLKLRAREFSVTRGNQRGKMAGRNNRMQRQLDQLELKADENRYETQSRARAPEQGQAQQQSREILNKLRDLAHRQEDLNDRLRELQSALEKAQAPREREELQRELKRLREQQQEILRDADEMIAQSQQSPGAQPSSETRQKLEDSRNHAERASQALDKGQLPQAVNEGTRAGEKLNELRGDFRKQSANQFADDMTDMRRQARDLDTRQQQLSQQLDGQQQSGGRSLRPAGEQAEAQAGLQQQQEQLHNLLDRMKQTVEAAEEPEPLLARQLYDAAREANQKRLEDALDIARKLADVGVRNEAGRALKSADQGINNLRRGVERAAESVLGDEAEALRRAQSEVNKLAEELNREIGQQAKSNSNQPGSQQTAESSARPGSDLSPSEDKNASNEPQREDNQSQTQPGQSPGESESKGGVEFGRQSAAAGNSRGSESNSDNPQNGPSAGEGQAGQRSLRGNNNGQPSSNQNTLNQLLERAGAENGGGGAGSPGGPITGRDFRDWSDRLRDVGEMLDDAELRGEAARIRDRAAEARTEFKKHAAEPNWEKLKLSIAEPLNELSRRIENELRRHESPDALVPIDRDPVPPEYTEQVRRYYERLGSGE